MRHRQPKVTLTTSTLTLFVSLLVESFLVLSARAGTFHWSNFVFRTLVLGPIFLIVVWWTMGRRSCQRKSLSDRDVRHWQYAAEGALNVAVRYIGDQKELQGKILRLRKKPRTIQSFSSSSHLSDTTQDDDESDLVGDNLEETLTQANDFIEWAMVPLLGRKYVPQSQVIQLDPQFIGDLAEKIDPDRPAKRRDAASLQTKAGVGLLMSDSAKIPCGCGKSCLSMCFEIKPKWGFLCTEPTEWEVKRRVDRFTMHQHMKQGSDPNAVSEYCPLLLFHGGLQGIKSSLRCLSRTPQNNLRLFVDGMLEFPNPKHRSLKQVLTSTLGAVGDLEEELFDGIAEALSHEDVLQRILKAQTIGPLNDIESVYPIFQEMSRLGESIGDIHLGFNTKTSPAVPPITAEDRAEIVKRFLISCTARDCSLMLTFSACPNPLKEALGKCAGGKWNYEITVVDLDAKPIAKMHHYFNVDREIAKTYTEYIEHLNAASSPAQRNIAMEMKEDSASSPSRAMAFLQETKEEGLSSPLRSQFSESKDEEKTKQ